MIKFNIYAIGVLPAISGQCHHLLPDACRLSNFMGR